MRAFPEKVWLVEELATQESLLLHAHFFQLKFLIWQLYQNGEVERVGPGKVKYKSE